MSNPATGIDAILARREELKRRDPDAILLFRVDDEESRGYRAFGSADFGAIKAILAVLRIDPHFDLTAREPWIGFPATDLDRVLGWVAATGKLAIVYEKVSPKEAAGKPAERVVTEGEIDPADMPRRKPWYVGTQNDGLYIIDRPPSPSNDHPDHERDCRVVAKVYQQPGEDEVAALLAAAPDQAEKLNTIEEAIRDYYLALDNREHGEIAQGRAFRRIEAVLGMCWRQGEEKRRREAMTGGSA